MIAVKLRSLFKSSMLSNTSKFFTKFLRQRNEAENYVDPNIIPSGNEICEFTHYRPAGFANPANFPANIYLLKVNSRNTRKRCEICSMYQMVRHILKFMSI